MLPVLVSANKLSQTYWLFIRMPVAFAYLFSEFFADARAMLGNFETRIVSGAASVYRFANRDESIP